MINKKVMPIEIPWSSTYLVSACEFAVMQSYPNSYNRILNRFIQMSMFENIVTGSQY